MAGKIEGDAMQAAVGNFPEKEEPTPPVSAGTVDKNDGWPIGLGPGLNKGEAVLTRSGKTLTRPTQGISFSN